SMFRSHAGFSEVVRPAGLARIAQPFIIILAAAISRAILIVIAITLVTSIVTGLASSIRSRALHLTPMARRARHPSNSLLSLRTICRLPHRRLPRIMALQFRRRSPNRRRLQRSLRLRRPNRLRPQRNHRPPNPLLLLPHRRLPLRRLHLPPPNRRLPRRRPRPPLPTRRPPRRSPPLPLPTRRGLPRSRLHLRRSPPRLRRSQLLPPPNQATIWMISSRLLLPTPR